MVCENETENKRTGKQIQLAVCCKTWLLLTFCIQLTKMKTVAPTIIQQN